MKKSHLILFLSFIIISCNKDKVNNSNVEKSETVKIENNTNNIITIEYLNSINGFNVSASWIIKDYASYHEFKYFVGPATLKFTDEKNGEIFYIQHPEFSVDISKDNLKHILFEDSEIFKGNHSFTQKINYKFPSTNKVGVYNDNSEAIDDYIPFFFQDVNFDNENELILTSAIPWDKGGSSNILYSKIYGDEYVEMKSEPFSSFNGFYNGNSESLAYSNTKIDYQNKKIIQSGICGAMCSSEIIFEFKKDENSYVLFKKTEINIDDQQKETIVTLYDNVGKPISIKNIK
jgi:hypothetical protein